MSPQMIQVLRMSLIQYAHWTFRPYTPIVKNKKYPPVLAPKSKLHPYIFTILMDGGPNFEIKTKNYQKSELFIWILD